MTALLKEIRLTEAQFMQISRLVYKHCGINLHDGKKELVRARLAKRLRQGNFNSFRTYIQHVLSDESGQEFSMLIDSLSTNLTSFFRENQHFEFLKNTFLPALLNTKRKNHDQKIRAWSAGCSSGEEPYSLAITLIDYLLGKGSWDVKVLATDISTSNIRIGKVGLYKKERIKSIPPILKQKYLKLRLINEQKIYEVNKVIRDAVIYRYLNLVQDWPIRGPIDFIFCRNVMIYFDKPTQQRLVNRFWDILDSGGLLFTGHSESLTGIAHKFDYVEPTIYIKP
jgi:chemotaxis protein methyltransferase CheR